MLQHVRLVARLGSLVAATALMVGAAPGTAWVNGIIPTSPAFPLHDNQAGEQNMANQVLGHL